MKNPDPLELLKNLKSKNNSKSQQNTFSILLFLKRSLMFLGLVFGTMLSLAFTDIPFYAYADFGTVESNYSESPEVIILLGGEGMPSADGLMRCYTATEKALYYPKTKIIIALPENKLSDEPLLASELMANELTIRGIEKSRISFETQGTNTHEQAELIFKKTESAARLLIITSPEHMTRAAACFIEEGFKSVGCSPTFEHDLSAESLLEKNGESYTPSLALRYNIWSYLQYEIRVGREYVALAYYKLRGWI